jgi:hypothetical protein
LYMNRHLPNTPIQSNLFGYISFIQIFFFIVFSHISLGRFLPLLVLSG